MSNHAENPEPGRSLLTPILAAVPPTGCGRLDRARDYDPAQFQEFWDTRNASEPAYRPAFCDQVQLYVGLFLSCNAYVFFAFLAGCSVSYHRTATTQTYERLLLLYILIALRDYHTAS